MTPPPLRALIREVADAYDAMPPLGPPCPMYADWRALGDACRADAWTVAHDLGRGFTVIDDPEPYPAAECMHRDYARGRFEVSRANSAHPLWSEATNVAFRTAHDVLGHCRARSGFDWIGELQACAAHGAWLHLDARRALFVECVMQTGTAIYRGAFPVQKCGDPTPYMTPALRDAYAHWIADPYRY